MAMQHSDKWKNPSLITDLYELTMAAAYFENDMRFTATFDLFVRKMPPNRGYMVLGGIERAVSYLGDLHFTAEEKDYLKNLPHFHKVSGGNIEAFGKSITGATCLITNKFGFRLSNP